MGRNILNAPEVSTSFVLSTAYKDFGKTAWAPPNTANWYDYQSTARWVTLKVMRDDPWFDIDWNYSVDHVDTWNSTVCRLTFYYSTNNKSTWSSAISTQNMMSLHNYVGGRNTCGNAVGTSTLYRPVGLSLVKGNYVAFGIQAYYDTSSNLTYMNQCSEDQSGGAQQDVAYRGGGAFMRVRELNPDLLDCWGNVNTNVS